MNLPKKLEEFKIESPCDGCKIKGKIDCEYCVDYSYYAINRGYMQKQLIKDQIPYTQALEKIKELEVLVAGAGLQGAKEGYQSIIKEQAEKLAQLEETALTKEEAGFIVEYFGVTDSASDFYLNSIPFYTQVIAKLQKIIGKEK